MSSVALNWNRSKRTLLSSNSTTTKCKSAPKSARKLPSLLTCWKRTTRMKSWRLLSPCSVRKCRKISSKLQSTLEAKSQSLSQAFTALKLTPKRHRFSVSRRLWTSIGGHLWFLIRKNKRTTAQVICMRPILTIRYNKCFQTCRGSSLGILKILPRKSRSRRISDMHSCMRPITTLGLSRLTDRFSVVYITGKSLPIQGLSMSLRLESQLNRHSMSTHLSPIMNLASLIMDSGSWGTLTTLWESHTENSSRRKVFSVFS